MASSVQSERHSSAPTGGDDSAVDREIAILAQQVVEGLEGVDQPLDSILRRAARLARMAGSDKLQRWLDLELRGFNDVEPVSREFLGHTRRWINEAENTAVWDALPVIEDRLHALHNTVACLQLGERPQAQVFQAVAREHARLTAQIARLSAIRSSVLALLHGFANELLDAYREFLPSPAAASAATQPAAATAEPPATEPLQEAAAAPNADHAPEPEKAEEPDSTGLALEDAPAAVDEPVTDYAATASDAVGDVAAPAEETPAPSASGTHLFTAQGGRIVPESLDPAKSQPAAQADLDAEAAGPAGDMDDDLSAGAADLDFMLESVEEDMLKLAKSEAKDEEYFEFPSDPEGTLGRSDAAPASSDSPTESHAFPGEAQAESKAEQAVALEDALEPIEQPEQADDIAVQASSLPNQADDIAAPAASLPSAGDDALDTLDTFPGNDDDTDAHDTPVSADQDSDADANAPELQTEDVDSITLALQELEAELTETSALDTQYSVDDDANEGGEPDDLERLYDEGPAIQKHFDTHPLDPEPDAESTRGEDDTSLPEEPQNNADSGHDYLQEARHNVETFVTDRMPAVMAEVNDAEFALSEAQTGSAFRLLRSLRRLTHDFALALYPPRDAHWLRLEQHYRKLDVEMYASLSPKEVTSLATETFALLSDVLQIARRNRGEA